MSKFIWIICFVSISVSVTNAGVIDNTDPVMIDLKIPDSSQVQIITTVGGSTLIGRIVEIGDGTITFETELGTQTIPIAKISEIKEIAASSIRQGKVWFPNPNTTRLFFGPTGRMLKKGKGYFSDYYLFFPGFAWGLSDNITLGAGMSLFPGLGLDRQLFFFTPKIGISASENLSLAAGALILKIPDWDDWDNGDNSPTVGIMYGVGTYGTADASLTGGLGFGFVDSEIAEKPMILFGAEARAGRRTAFVTENWVIPEVENILMSYGIRFFGESLSIDLAFITPFGEDFFFPGVPYIDFVFNF
ncbi:MAG: hypothetical protein KOO62_00330 [candidate division Zixibacteria bacterium]|nr:hypothetical protein [candidate division Zixibacteria bacterium]